MKEYKYGVYKECMTLPFTKCKIDEEKNLSVEIYKQTCDEIKGMTDRYSCSEILATLGSIWSEEDALKVFNYFEFEKCTRKINTIATFYRRGYLGGIECVNAELLNIWTQMGLKLIFFTEEPESQLDFEYPGSVKRIVIPTSDLLQRFDVLQKKCIEEQVDLFINHSMSDTIWECILLRMMGLYYSKYCHSHFSWDYNGGRGALLLTDKYRFCDMVFAISKSNARFYQLSGCKTYLVQNPVPRALRNIMPASKVDNKRILMVGRLSQEKYPFEAIRAFEIVHNAIGDAKLDIVGDGDLYRSVKDYVDERNLADSVIFHGAKSSSELEQYYRNASCILFTSKMEGYPMMLIEAKAYGIPIVMYDMPYLTLVKDGKGILTAPVGDIEGLSKHIIKLLNDDKYRKIIGEEARESFEVFEKHDQIGEWENVFKILQGEMDTDIVENYFSPSRLDQDDSSIIPMLIDRLKDGYQTEVENRIEYKIGRKLVMLPRMLVRKIRKIKQKML